MKKVIVNSCFGGFSLSEEAQQWMSDHGAPYVEYGSDPEYRSDPLLVECVEELGERANGPCAELRIEEYDENEYSLDYIDEYDGQESLVCVPIVREDVIRGFVKDQDLDGLISYLSEKGINVRNPERERAEEEDLNNKVSSLMNDISRNVRDYNFYQMDQIKAGFKDGLSEEQVATYAKPWIDDFQMADMRKELEKLNAHTDPLDGMIEEARKECAEEDRKDEQKEASDRSELGDGGAI